MSVVLLFLHSALLKDMKHNKRFVRYHFHEVYSVSKNPELVSNSEIGYLWFIVKVIAFCVVKDNMYFSGTNSLLLQVSMYLQYLEIWRLVLKL